MNKIIQLQEEQNGRNTENSQIQKWGSLQKVTEEWKVLGFKFILGFELFSYQLMDKYYNLKAQILIYIYIYFLNIKY